MLNPYNLIDQPVGKQFTSDSGSSYLVYLQDYSYVFDNLSIEIPVYHFGFEPIADRSYDARVSDTICYYLDLHLSNNDCIVFYTPDNIDQRGKATRSRLFALWWHKHCQHFNCPGLFSKKYFIEYDGQAVTPVTIFYKQQHEAHVISIGKELENLTNTK